MTSVTLSSAEPFTPDPSAGPGRLRAVPPAPGNPAAPGHAAISPARCARWARAEGLRPGDRVALLVRAGTEIAALRLGLAQVGVRADAVDLAPTRAASADRLAACRLAIVDTALADAYVGLLGADAPSPAVWWNGADADFARLDLALAEYDDAPLLAAELIAR